MIQFTVFTSQQIIAVLQKSHRLSSAILASCLGLSLIAPSYAGERIRWTPDTDRGNVESTLSGGRRGQEAVSCSIDDGATRLALMVPGDRSNLLTTKSNPTLAWHVSTTMPVSMTLHVSDPALATPIYSQTIELEKTATVSVTLPEDNRLALHKKYRWTVFVSCPGDHHAEISARSFVEHINRESLDVSNLSSLERASTYANQGIWYDAIAVLLAARSQGVTDAETMVQTLLEQGQSPAEIPLSAVVHL
ncbi:DUF928 domain-containing protein [Adonisia turfae]|uniref:DUF928 domain-containing protein n=1 Tax=Adonisia turfae CCMR0081 TaxID=2292702 RepID=A0A6M0RT96_9CYAN|nr:DUF928 domain-containing protein [Adonisia turfae]NEZ58972.1 DUF928 domain-containing protein [Adonisia turfae CCMR0081]